MPLQIMQARGPAPKEKEESILDKIAKGANIAQSAFGIYSDLGKLSDMQKQTAMKEDELSRLRQGFIYGKDLLDHGDNWDFSDKGSPGAIGFTTPYGTKYGTPKKKKAEGEDALSQAIKMGQYQKLQGELAVQKSEMPFKILPKEKQEMISDAAKKLQEKSDIKASIDSALEIFRNPQISEDQKIVLGENLAKTVNSEQGRDAVGNQEADRILSLLKFKKFNFTEPGSFFGRDLDEFENQLDLASQRINKVMARTQQGIDSAYGRRASVEVPGLQIPKNKKLPSQFIESANASTPKLNQQDVQALSWAQENISSKDPKIKSKAMEIISHLKTKGL